MKMDLSITVQFKVPTWALSGIDIHPVGNKKPAFSQTNTENKWDNDMDFQLHTRP